MRFGGDMGMQIAKSLGKHAASHMKDVGKRGAKHLFKKSPLGKILKDEEIEKLTDTGIEAISKLIK